MRGKEVKGYLSHGIIWWIITVILSLYIKRNPIPIMDLKVQGILTPLGNSILYWPLVIITYLVDTKTAFFLTVITMILLLHKYKNQLYFNFLLCTTMGGGVVITYFAKTFVQRERPGEIFFMDVWGFFTEQVSYSFPSGHVIKAFLLFTTIGFIINWEERDYKKILNILLKGLILLIGIGQIILNRHYLTDILGGYSLGLAWFYSSLVITEIIYPILAEKIKFIQFFQGSSQSRY
ncbi:phosphatase PAP2 family protein [Anaerobranca gottschalkii]|uniref:Membrane-associated phospholipid phosphatase n=1 Tax=Anaerobranca gottschalkii DSM 13577 TaxID=1120990 RepID=A0A1I0A028_9FIRM|nr:phosphatase PAP2 family protein [Anaerobranca gottschalkii]SES87270.1 Membrane-associated phospholipid phosphatase [Anaerobranca gottschalkii DSM 13577]